MSQAVQIPDKWDERFLLLASHVAGWSKDPSTKVGCVITDTQRRILSLGYNGFPRGVSDNEHRLSDRDLKYPMTVHAELNAVLTANASLAGARLYCPTHPCPGCAGAIIQAGIATVICWWRPGGDYETRWYDEIVLAATMFREAGVCVQPKKPL